MRDRIDALRGVITSNDENPPLPMRPTPHERDGRESVPAPGRPHSVVRRTLSAAVVVPVSLALLLSAMACDMSDADRQAAAAAMEAARQKAAADLAAAQAAAAALRAAQEAAAAAANR